MATGCSLADGGGCSVRAAGSSFLSLASSIVSFLLEVIKKSRSEITKLLCIY